ncbi:MAG: glycosyltransferase [Deltaproteobacteria bacterium]|nr:glycosyltransferase [Deltaproteobacteria bacterium]
MLELVEEKWVKKKPLFNVIIRTHNRPNFFHDCIKSVYDQDYTNYNIYVAVDGARSLRYVCGHQCAILGVGQPSEAISDKPEGVEYGEWYPANLCYSRILRFIRTGYVLYLDDDACLANPHAMSMIANAIEQSKSEVVFWRVVFSDSVVPDEVGWEKRSLALGNVVSSGYCHSVHLTPSWEPWRHAGYRTAEYLTEATKKITWLDAQTVRVQRRRKEDSTVHDKAGIVVSHYTNVVVAIAAHNAAETLERCLDSVWMNRCGNTFRVLVGIDGCAETLALARKLTRKYQGQFEFFHTGARNKGTYVVRNALLMKVILRDSLVFFLDADDVLPDGFIPFYLNEYNSLAMEKGFNGALQARMCSINDREIQLPSANEFDHLTSQTAVSTESFFCSLEALKHMGLFNEFRVAQGADFLERIRLAGIGVHFVDNGPYFIKAVREKSLSNHHALGIGTPERKNIVAENQKRIEQGIILADAICTKLSIVL